ncbi:unnamed protein product [Parnassius apollo]|uniref:(apollo) hypothetical protein n=1 Tax=Parnassius apollo TaxID=110799 RepID=A0A8S3WV93_PARAO|nr:unnamed protein product [Parnassius apollo]
MSRRNSDLPIWNFFDKPVDGRKTATCNYCRRELSFKTSVTNLKQKHLSVYNNLISFGKTLESAAPETVSNIPLSEVEGLHVENVGDGNRKRNAVCSGSGEMGRRINCDEPPKKIQRTMQAYIPKRLEPDDKNKIDLNFLKMIVYDFQPFSIVKDVGFRAHTHALIPNYEIPDRKTLSVNLLPKVYEKRLEELKSFVQMNAKSVCITIDYWTSRTMDSYMGITAHFMTEDPIELKSVLIQCGESEGHQTGIKVYRELKSLLENWGIYDKVNFFVTDNGGITWRVPQDILNLMAGFILDVMPINFTSSFKMHLPK